MEIHHFLMMGPTLLCISAGDDEGHVKEDLLGLSSCFVPEVLDILQDKLDIHPLL
jgi:hypothetical protein